MHRMPAMVVKEEENRPLVKRKARHVPRMADSVRQVRTPEIMSPVDRTVPRVDRDHRAAVRMAEETEAVMEEAMKEEEMAETVLETVLRMERDVRQDRAKETEVRARMTIVAETVSEAEQTVAREARADVLKVEEAEITVSADRTVAVRADSARDREEAVLPIPYLLLS